MTLSSAGRRRFNITRSLFASLGIAASLLIVFVPKNTHADQDNELFDADRAGEWDERGSRFGDVVIKGELVRAATGWVLVRTVENLSDEPKTAAFDERLSRGITSDGARVSTTPVTLILRTQTFALKPHEKQSIGIPVPADIGARMDASEKIRAVAAYAAKQRYDEDGEERNGASERLAVIQRSRDAFAVEYLTALPPGKKAGPNESYISSNMPGPRRRHAEKAPAVVVVAAPAAAEPAAADPY